MHQTPVGSSTTEEPLFAIAKPSPLPGANQRLLMGLGAPLAPTDRLKIFGDKQFENFVHEWVHGYLHGKYSEVQRVGASSDKGRDVVAWLDTKNATPRRWDNYQCKLYKDKLTPSQIWIELGKLVFYTHDKDYTVPSHYYFVTREGLSSTLLDLLNAPEKLRAGLIDNWGTCCTGKITSTRKIGLNQGLKTYIEKFDFSIVESIPPLTLIEQHSKTPYHAAIFGSAFLKPRPKPKKPSAEVAPHEARYVKKLFDAFADHTQKPVSSTADVAFRPDLLKQFQHCRESFYSAESLKEFARDALPDGEYFTDLEDQFLEGVTMTLNKLFPDGYQRMVETCEHATKLQITAHPLGSELRPLDRVGICHQLANEDRLSWVPDNS